ncbi:winged helix-turn-helix domain-containing protein [Nocardia sp. NPDC051321]|uniref:AfsR/SARP family transcriptional regulator n=1 Tax=Nocardia sp. NPDC051321 TaxID=3364323 RepID=UPI00379AB8A7
MENLEHTVSGVLIQRDVAVRCRVLGPIEVEIDGVPVDLRGARPRQLLAALSFAAGASVSNEALAEYLWGRSALDQPSANVRVVVHRLRAALGPHAGQILALDRCGYWLMLAPEHTDHGQFANLIGAGTHALLDDRADEAVDTLRAGLALWRGQPWLERRLLDHDPGLLPRDAVIQASSRNLVRGFRSFPAARQAS